MIGQSSEAVEKQLYLDVITTTYILQASGFVFGETRVSRRFPLQLSFLSVVAVLDSSVSEWRKLVFFTPLNESLSWLLLLLLLPQPASRLSFCLDGPVFVRSFARWSLGRWRLVCFPKLAERFSVSSLSPAASAPRRAGLRGNQADSSETQLWSSWREGGKRTSGARGPRGH